MRQRQDFLIKKKIVAGKTYETKCAAGKIELNPDE